MNEVLHEVPYITLMMMNGVVPRYKTEGGGTTGTSNRPKSLFEIAADINNGKGC